MKQIRKSGITIVTLVITVIVLAILTGAVMLTMVGDNGIFGETQTTIDKYNKQATLEQIQLKIQKKRLAKVNEGQYSLKLEEDILPILETFGTYNANEMKLTTTEKNIEIYLYEIVNIPIKEIANVTYANEELTIIEKVLLPNGYTFEYTKDNGITWSEYTSTTTIAEENGILIRLKNEEGKVVSSEYKVTSGVIEEIDSTKPIISIDTNGVTTGKTIKVTIIVTDEKGLDRNNTYEYCISTSNTDTTNTTWIPYTNGISFTVGEGLTGGYYIHVKGVTDTSGNESENKVSEMLTFDNTVPAVTIDIGRITDTSIEVLAQSTDNSGQVKSTEYSIDNGAHWYTANTFTNLTANTEYTVKVKSVDIFDNENTVEKAVTTNPRTWNGKVDISWYTKDPNKTTFDISTPNELAGLALLVDNETVYYDDPHDANAASGTYSIAGSEFEGKTIVLNNDILINENVLNDDGTLNETNASTFVQWEPIGDTVYSYNEDDGYIVIENDIFKGTFNGQGNDISGMYISVQDKSVGLFANNHGLITNVNLTDVYIYNDLTVMGSFTGGLVADNESEITDCSFDGKIYVDFPENIDVDGVAGGIFGCSGRLNNNTIIRNCTNYGDIYGRLVGGCGGTIGYARNNISGTLLKCYNYGTITGLSASGVCRSAIYSMVEDCVNFGLVEGNGNSTGILWHCQNSKVTNCYNNGTIKGQTIGGVVGSTHENSIVINCYNIGQITSNTEYEHVACGGISCSLRDSNVINCFNAVDFDVNKRFTGGIIADINNSTENNILNCYNLGNIQSASNNVGGIGSIYYGGTTNLNNCFNVGQIGGNATYKGGILGFVGNNSTGTIQKTYNIDVSYIGRIDSGSTISPQELDLITGTGPNASITVNGQTKTVIQALNEWVTANKTTYPELKYWSWDNVNNRPMFVDSI